jgi:hypothetical protein
MRHACCHPEAPHKKLRIPEWYVSSLMMDRALDAVVRRVKTLDRSHDIRYLAGYSLDAKTIDIDRHLPKVFKYRGRDIEVDCYLILHAHQIATRAEQAAICAENISWHDDDLLRRMQQAIDRGEAPRGLGGRGLRDKIGSELARIAATRPKHPPAGKDKRR